MKRFIAAALSVLVGTFGYTIVDSTIEARVSSLESEVVILKEEVSKFHSAETDTSQTTLVPISQEFTTAVYPEQGFFLDKSPDFQDVFLFRKYSNGNIQYFSANNLNNLNPVTGTPDYDDYLLYITSSSAQIVCVEEQTTIKDLYNKDYSTYPTTVVDKTVTVSVVIKGYTDSAFAGKKIDFNFDCYPQPTSSKCINNTIQSDGSFSCCKEYIIKYTEREYLQGITNRYTISYPVIYS